MRSKVVALCVASAVAVGVAASLVALPGRDSGPQPVATTPGGASVATDGSSPPGTFGPDGKPLFDAREELVRLAEDQGVEAAVDALARWVAASDNFARECHNEAHLLGSTAARLRPASEVVVFATTRCDFGYVHGVLKATALDSPPGTDPNELVRICENAPADVIVDCEHGLGHAIPLRDNLSFTESLEMCSRLDKDLAQAQCVNGAMMEFGVNYMYFHDLRSIDPGSLDKDGNLKPLDLSDIELARPCDPLRGTSWLGALDMCYRHLHYFWAPELGEDYLTFERRCAGLDDDDNGSCYQSLGAWAWYAEEFWADAPGSDHQRALDASCMTLRLDAGRNGCIHGYLHTVWQSEPNPNKLPSICEHLGPRYEPGCSSSEIRFRN
jgi:hypothetical protein